MVTHGAPLSSLNNPSTSVPVKVSILKINLLQLTLNLVWNIHVNPGPECVLWVFYSELRLHCSWPQMADPYLPQTTCLTDLHQRSSYVTLQVLDRRKPSYLLIITLLSASLALRRFSLTARTIRWFVQWGYWTVLGYPRLPRHGYPISSLNLTYLASYDHNVPTPVQLSVNFCFVFLPYQHL